jgi:hypothetical protein
LRDQLVSARRPVGVTAVAVIFFVAAGYLIILGLLILAVPGAVSMTMGSPILNGLELAGPYMFLLVGAVGAAIGFGLLRLNNWARRVAILASLVGMVMLIPSVSAAAVDFRPALFWNGLGVIIRMVVVWYLYQSPVAETFQR